MGLKLKYADPVTIGDDKMYYIKHSRKRIYLLSLEQIHTIIAGVEWLFYNIDTPNGKQVSINPRLVFNPARNIKIRFAKLRGPEDGLGNISFYEFMHAETFLYRYNKTNDNQWLAMFIATLWRPMRKGTVLPFDYVKLERWAKRTVKVKPHVALAMVWYYEGCKYFLSTQFPDVFTGGGVGKPTDPFKGYMDLTATLAGADPTKMEAVRHANLYDTLGALQQMIKQSEKRK